MAVVIRRNDGEPVVARQVTESTRAAAGEWLHSRGYALFNIAGVPTGSWVVLDGDPAVFTAEEFVTAFDTAVIGNG